MSEVMERAAYVAKREAIEQAKRDEANRLDAEAWAMAAAYVCCMEEEEEEEERQNQQVEYYVEEKHDKKYILNNKKHYQDSVIGFYSGLFFILTYIVVRMAMGFNILLFLLMAGTGTLMMLISYQDIGDMSNNKVSVSEIFTKEKK